MTAFDKVVVAVALLLVGVSFLAPGGLIIGLTLGVALLVAVYGGKYLLQLEMSRRMGEKAPRERGIRDKIAGGSDGDKRWNR